MVEVFRDARATDLFPGSQNRTAKPLWDARCVKLPFHMLFLPCIPDGMQQTKNASQRNLRGCAKKTTKSTLRASRAFMFHYRVFGCLDLFPLLPFAAIRRLLPRLVALAKNCRDPSRRVASANKIVFSKPIPETRHRLAHRRAKKVAYPRSPRRRRSGTEKNFPYGVPKCLCRSLGI